MKVKYFLIIISSSRNFLFIFLNHLASSKEPLLVIQCATGSHASRRGSQQQALVGRELAVSPRTAEAAIDNNDCQSPFPTASYLPACAALWVAEVLLVLDNTHTHVHTRTLRHNTFCRSTLVYPGWYPRQQPLDLCAV